MSGRFTAGVRKILISFESLAHFLIFFFFLLNSAISATLFFFIFIFFCRSIILHILSKTMPKQIILLISA